MFIYQLLIRLISPLILLILLIEAYKKQAGTRFLKQRLGLGYGQISKTDLPTIWLHCASVGEVKAVEKLVESLLEERRFIITTNTQTGAKLVQQLFNDKVKHVFCPVDWPYAIRHFLNCTSPNELWVVETEIWPNLYEQCHQRAIPISLINGRLSQKTLQSPAWLKSAYRLTLGKVSKILTRNQQEADRFITLGADMQSIHILGNLKYAGLSEQPEFVNPLSRPYVLLASSHAGEEVEITQRWLQLNRSELLVIVPRHPKRTPELLKTLNLSQSKLSVFSLQHPITDETRVYLDDQIGVLMPLFHYAKLVIMGGSFVPKGGHNVLEPAACEATILTGPDMSDFEEETAILKQHDAIIQVESYEQLFAELCQLLDNESQRKILGVNAHLAITRQAHILNDYRQNLLQQNPS